MQRAPESLRRRRSARDAPCGIRLSELPQLRPPPGAAASADRAAGSERAVTEWIAHAAAARRHRDWSAADAALRRALLAADRAGEFAQVGDVLSAVGEYERACEAYGRALALDPDQPRYLFNRAALRRFVGALAEAEQDYDRVIALDPSDAEAWLNRSELRRQTSARNHVEALERHLAAGLDTSSQEVPIRYALAKELEDLGRYTDAWRHLVRGAELRRRQFDYDVRIDLATFEWIIQAFPIQHSAGAGNASPEPIFIVGMPRTGTTLLERLMGGSAEVFAAGELPHFAAALTDAVRARLGKPRIPRQEMVATSASLDFDRLGADYLDRTRPGTLERPRFTDKMPLNFLYCGLIRRALPNARIVHVTRHPLATCHAVFKTLFNRGYPFSYDLAELAEYFVGYRRLMAHWHRAHPGEILDVSYERLVGDSAAETRRVFEFCGLDWNPGILDTQRPGAPMTTASAAQARQPIYTSSVDLWHRYAPALEPVAVRLRRAGIALED